MGCNKGEDENVVRCNIATEYPYPWFFLQEKLFPIIIQVFLDDKLLKNSGMTQRIIRDRSTSCFFIRLCCHCVTHTFLESGRKNGCHIILR